MNDAIILDQMRQPKRRAKFLARLAPEGDCLVWTMAINNSGYGVFRIGTAGTSYTCGPHRVAWMLAHDRELGPGMEIDHRCRNRICCNPDHLDEVDRRENVQRSYGRTLEPHPTSGWPPPEWRDLAPVAKVVKTGKRTIRVRNSGAGTRFVVIWRDYLDDGSIVQRGRTFSELGEAEAACERIPVSTNQHPGVSERGPNGRERA